MHPGRPLEAWCSFVGLKTSWLSREIIVFGMFATVALMYAGSFWLPALSRFVPIPFWRELSSSLLQNWFGIGVAITGLAGVFSSMMIYQDTRRTFWRISSYLARLKHRDRRRPDELQTWKHDQTNSANPLAIWWRAAPVDSPARTAGKLRG